MTLTQLRVFCTVASFGSFTAAAQRLFTTQPAVSMQIRALEDAMGVRLFVRRGRAMVLTDPGRLLLDRALRALELLDDVQRDLGAVAAGSTGRLRIGATGTFALYYLPTFLKKFRQRYPGVDFVLRVERSEDQVAMLTHGQLDVGFVWDLVAPATVDMVPLGRERFVLVSAPGYTPPQRVVPAALCAHPFITAQSGSTMRQFVEDRLYAAGASIDVVMDFASTEAIKRAVEMGLGISILARATVRDELRARRLRAHALVGLPLWRKFHLVTMRGGSVAPVGDVLIKEAVAFFRERRGLAL